MQRRLLSLGVLVALAGAATTIAPSAASAQRYGNPDRGYGHDRGYARGEYDRGGYDRHPPRCSGTGGAILGAVAGGLLGHAVAGYGDRTAGTLVGGGLGAVAGNAIGRNC